MIDYKEFNHQLDGHWEDILESYGIEVPQMHGINSKNYPCPLCGGDDRAHWRDVSGRLCLFCRNCAADSMHPPENVIMEYAGIDFSDLVNDLASYINHVPIDRVINAQKRVRAPKFNLPADDKRDSKKTQSLIDKCEMREVGGCNLYEYHGMQFIALETFGGDLVNVCELGRDNNLLAGGVSYGAFTKISKSDSANYLAVVSVWDARKLAEKFNCNALICFTPYNLKYVCRNAPDNMNIKPVMRSSDSMADYLCEEMDWIKLDSKNTTIKNMKKGELL